MSKEEPAGGSSSRNRVLVGGLLTQDFAACETMSPPFEEAFGKIAKHPGEAHVKVLLKGFSDTHVRLTLRDCGEGSTKRGAPTVWAAPD